MSWREDIASNPVMVEASGATAFGVRFGMYGVTSLSTLRLATGALRTFGLTSDVLRGAVDNAIAARYLTATHSDTPWTCGQAPTAGACTDLKPGCSIGAIGYVDSGAYDEAHFDCTVTTVDRALGIIADQIVDPADCSTGPCGSQPVHSTCVPEKKRSCTEDESPWQYEYLDTCALSGGFPNVCTPSYAVREERFAVHYKDPSVVELPAGGGYLMLLSRLRSYDAVAAVDTCGGCPVAALGGPATTIGDIVAFWSDNPEFDDGAGTVRGPFLIVDSLDALPGISLRFWLSVPGGAVISNGDVQALFVYYQVEASADPDPLQAGAATYPDGGVTNSEYFAVLGHYPYASRSATRVFSGAPAVRRIALDDLLAHVGDAASAGTGSTDEAAWTRSDAVPGDLLGQVRIWLCNVAEYGPMPQVRLFDRVYEQGSGTSRWFPRVADPAPVDSGKALTLYFSTIDVEGHVPAPGDGYGIWRGVAVDGAAEGGPTLVQTTTIEGQSEDGTIMTVVETIEIEPIYGVDFLACSAIDPVTGLPKDQLAEAVGTNYVDPDPVWSGVWRVLFGVPKYNGDPTTMQAMKLHVGEFADGTTRWEDAWCEPEDEGQPAADDDAEDAHVAMPPAALRPFPRQSPGDTFLAGITLVSRMETWASPHDPRRFAGPARRTAPRLPAQPAERRTCGCG